MVTLIKKKKRKGKATSTSLSGEFPHALTEIYCYTAHLAWATVGAESRLRHPEMSPDSRTKEDLKM